MLIAAGIEMPGDVVETVGPMRLVKDVLLQMSKLRQCTHVTPSFRKKNQEFYMPRARKHTPLCPFVFKRCELVMSQSPCFDCRCDEDLLGQTTPIGRQALVPSHP
jgi:hypothetical protein